MQANVYEWVGRACAKYEFEAPVLEVGAGNINGSIRGLFPEPYTGMDIEAGPGVDDVQDVLTCHYQPETFSTIVCCETLEHVTKPWLAVERMAEWLKPGGYLLLSAPFSHFIHDYPGDYWRFTGQGFRVLFEEAGLTTVETAITAHAGHFMEPPTVSYNLADVLSTRTEVPQGTSIPALALTLSTTFGVARK
jgi:SAM-dependent methyltransferase